MKNFEKPSFDTETKEKLEPRHATRTVLFDQDGQVAIINVTKHGYYKVPGGGIEENEEPEISAQREVMEESGCNCIITESLGRLETPVPIWNMYDISDGFIAVIDGEKSTPNYEEWEEERGFKLEWFQNLDTAIATIEQNVIKEPGMEALQARDLKFLKMAKEKLTV